jgi:hypothetical protein
VRFGNAERRGGGVRGPYILSAHSIHSLHLILLSVAIQNSHCTGITLS